jgi:hypothetical protein
VTYPDEAYAGRWRLVDAVGGRTVLPIVPLSGPRPRRLPDAYCLAMDTLEQKIRIYAAGGTLDRP